MQKAVIWNGYCKSKRDTEAFATFVNNLRNDRYVFDGSSGDKLSESSPNMLLSDSHNILIESLWNTG
jgi:hypothetical protein